MSLGKLLGIARAKILIFLRMMAAMLARLFNSAKTPTTPPRGLEDTLLLAGLFNSGEAEAILNSLRQAKEARLTREDELYNFDLGLIEKHVEDVKKLDSLRGQQTQLLAAQHALLRRLLLKRYDYPLRVFYRKVEEYTKVSRDLLQGILSGVQENFSLGVGSSNGAEHDRRLARIEERRGKAEGRFKEVEEYINDLRRFGITRTTAGFLSWGGYLSFPAFGWFIGETVRELRESEPGLAERIFALLAGGIKTIFDTAGLGWGIAGLLVLPILFLAFMFVFFWLLDKFLRSFDPAWEKQKARRVMVRGSRGDILGWDGLSRPAGNVVRSDYTQSLAKLPFIYIWTMLLIGLATLLSLGGRTIDFKMPDPWQSLLYIYFGAILYVVVSGTVLLYCTKVVEPRRRHYLREEKSGLLNTIRANIELLVAVLLFLVVVVLSDLFPVFGQVWSAGRTVAIFLSILLGSFIVSYGLIYKGIFKDYDVLKRDLLAAENMLEKYAVPLAADLVEEEFERYQSELSRLQEEIYHGRQNWIRRWFGLRYAVSIRNGARLRLSAYDEILEPQLVGEIIEVNQKAELINREIEYLKGAIREVKGRLNGQLIDSEKERMRRYQEYLETRSRVEQEFAEMIVRGDTAYKMGTFLRSVLSARRREGFRVQPRVSEEPQTATAGRAESTSAREKGDGGLAEEMRKVREQVISLIRDNSNKMDEMSKEFNELAKRLESLDQGQVESLIELIKSV